MNVLSLFDGISCGQLALNRAGVKYDKYYSSEIDQNAIKIAQLNFPDTIQLGSVHSVKAENLEPIDLLIGGSPCQGFSFAGNMLSFNDPRSQLFFEFVRLVRECKPKYFLLENVVMRKQDQAVITTLLGVSPIKINSSLVSAQNRPRLYWTNIPIHSLPNDKGITFGSVMESNPSPKYNLSQSAIDRVLNALRGRKKFYGAHSPKVGAMLAQYAKNPTDGCYVDDGVSKRRITPLEAERLQTLPDGYTASVADTHRYHAIGNGWTVDVIAHIFGGLNQPVPTP